MKKIFARIITVVLAMTFCLVAANATEMNIEASEYLSYYGAVVGTSGSGKIDISYTVSSYASMTQIGASKIVVQEKVGSSWASVKYYYSSTTSSLLDTDSAFYTNTITYQGTAGKTYRATVTFYAGDSTGYDTRDFITNSVTA